MSGSSNSTSNGVGIARPLGPDAIQAGTYHTSRDDLRRISGLSEGLFSSRVDIDYADTTSGNADETRAWAKKRGFTKLIVVTSSYHMPRSLIELRRTMPGATLLPHPVQSNRVHAGRWWMDAYTTRILLAEYVKFLPTAARYGAARVLGWEERAVASGFSGQ